MKLFPRECQDLVEAIQARILKESGKHVEVMVYGDGAFKDPVGKIWELADPVVSPAYTASLEAPQRAQAQVSGGQRLCRPVRRGAAGCHQRRDQKEGRLPGGQNGRPGHHAPPPDRSDRLLCKPDLGSGDKGTPIVYISGLFRQLHHRIRR